MTRICLVLGLVGLMAVTAAAVGVRVSWVDARDVLTAPQPCVTGLKGAVSAVVRGEVVYALYTCNDDTVYARAFGLQADMPTVQPVAVLPSCPGGMVVGIYGGCVPPDHPLAPRR